MLLASSLNNNSWTIKTLAFADQLRKDLHELVLESTRQLSCPSLKTEGLVAKLFLDTVEAVNPRHLVACLISDLQFYRDVHSLLDQLEA